PAEGGWSADFRDYADGGFDDPAARGYKVISQSETLPWINVTEIKIQFSERVQLVGNDIQIVVTPGYLPDFTRAPTPSLVEFRYDAETFVATLTFDGDPAAAGI